MATVSNNPVVQKALFQQERMLRVAFLVGNGFDIGLGLKTSYNHFISHYIGRDSKHCVVIQKLIDHINRNAANWGDAEYAFGQLPFGMMGDDAESTLRICIKDFQRALEEYLRGEAARLTISSEKAESTRVLLLQSIVEAIAQSNSGLFKGKDRVVIDIVNFNYTDTVDRLLLVDGYAHPNVIAKVDGERLEVNIGKSCHVHGKLGSALLFGVDNNDQIFDPTIRELSESEGYLLKPEKASIGNLQFYDEAQGIIGECDIAFLFGLSYGKTDLSWWKSLVRHCNNEVAAYLDKKPKVVLCSYSTSPINRYTIEDKVFVERKEREKFLKALKDDGGAGAWWGDEKEWLCVVAHGPFHDELAGVSYYCDPLHLHSLGLMFVNGYDGEPILEADYP